MTRPRYLDRLGIDDRHIAGAVIVVALLVASLFSGCEIPQPWPVPPIPDPINPPGPVIVVPPVTQGQRIALIVHESHDQNPELARLIVDLQAGKSSEYFASHRHSVFALDIDAKDENRQPLAVITRLKPIIGNKPLPVLIVGDKTSEGRLGKVLYCESLVKDAGGSDVVAITKKTGGGE